MAEIHDVRVSEIQPGQEWLDEGSWALVTEVEVNHPDDRVLITYREDGDIGSTRKYRGFERAAVRWPEG